MDSALAKRKSQQACRILKELGSDCWLVWVRETMQFRDPAVSLVLGMDVISPTALLYTSSGERIAVSQEIDARGLPEELFERIVPYGRDIRGALRAELERIAPAEIAVDYSTDSECADGLTHGMHQNLVAHLSGTPYADRLVSAAPIVERLIGRKLPEEVERIERAIAVTERIFEDLAGWLRPGQTEVEIAGYARQRMAEYDVGAAWDSA